MVNRLEFVDAIAAAPTVRLNLNDGNIWHHMVDASEFPPPPLNRAMSSSLLTDGVIIPASAYGPRSIRLSLALRTDDADYAATNLQALHRELDRPRNLLRWQQGTTLPVFFRTFRASPDAVRDLGTLRDGTRKRIDVELIADPFAFGLMETLGPYQILVDPAAHGHATVGEQITGDNAGFEGSLGTWVNDTNATVTRTTAQDHTGVASMGVTAVAAANAIARHVSAAANGIPVMPGGRYYVAAWFRAATTTRTVRVGVRWYDAGSVLLSTTTSSSAIESTTGFALAEMAAVAPTSAAFAVVIAQIEAPAAAELHYVDDVQFSCWPGHFDVTGIKGDVETPAVMFFLSNGLLGAGQASCLSVRRRDDPTKTPMLLQAEAMTAGTDTSVQANSATYSGGGNNFMRTTFATVATLTTRLTATLFPSSTDGGLDARGQYRVFVRYLSSAVDTFPMRIRYGSSSTFMIDGPTILAPSATTTPRHLELGDITIPVGHDPGALGYGADLPTRGVRLELQIGRTGVTASLDTDFLALFPASDRLMVLKWPTDPDSFGGILATHVVLDGVARRSYHARNDPARIFSGRPGEPIGGMPLLSPGRLNRIYFAQDVGTNQAPIGNWAQLDALYYWPRYLSARPVAT